MSNAEKISEDLWNGGGFLGTIEVPKAASEGLLAFAEFVFYAVPNGEDMLVEFVDRIAEAIDNYDPTPYAIAFDGRPMSRDEFSTSA